MAKRGVPEGWTRTQRPPIKVGGYTWLSYKSGIMRFTLFCEELQAFVYDNFEKPTYTATVNGKTIGRLFRSETAAMKAAAKARGGTP